MREFRGRDDIGLLYVTEVDVPAGESAADRAEGNYPYGERQEDEARDVISQIKPFGESHADKTQWHLSIRQSKDTRGMLGAVVQKGNGGKGEAV